MPAPARRVSNVRGQLHARLDQCRRAGGIRVPAALRADGSGGLQLAGAPERAPARRFPMSERAGPAAEDPSGMGFKQFVAYVAAVMATNALAIDTMLPALPVIGRALGVTADNDRQWIITAYLLGFGSAQIVY